MSLGTLDRTPPPFFRQGPSALTKLTFFSALALLLMVADTRFQITQPVRAVIATVLHPVERTLLVPVAAWEGGSDYLVGLQKALTQATTGPARSRAPGRALAAPGAGGEPTTGACARCSSCARP